MKESEFNRLIKKYQRGLLSDKEKAMVEEWFQELGKDKKVEDWLIEDKLKVKHRILKHIDRGGETIFITDSRKPAFSPKSKIFNVVRVAASLLLLATIFYMLWQFRGIGEQKEVISEVSTLHEINKVILADGSIVWLKHNSKLIYPEEFTGEERHVILKGEALFEVAKDPVRPFIIQCGELTTTVLGTSFNIKSSKKDIEVVVLTGKVSLTSENDKQEVIILPNEKAVYSMEQKQIAKVNAEVDFEEEENIASGTEYRMDFEDNRMKEIIRRIEGKFNVKVDMRDPKIGNCMITADFTGQSLEQTLSMITQALGYDYEIKDKTVILYGAGCKSTEEINTASSFNSLSAVDSADTSKP